MPGKISSAWILHRASGRGGRGLSVKDGEAGAAARTTIRAVVFDLDSLMFDTEAPFFRVSSEALVERGKWFTPEMKSINHRQATRE
jgi:hypothetical protein